MRNSIIIKILISLYLLISASLFSQDKNLEWINGLIDSNPSLSDSQLISILERTQELQDVQYKNDVMLILNRIDSNSLLKHGDPRVSFLINLIQGRNLYFERKFDDALNKLLKTKELENYGIGLEIIDLYRTIGLCFYRKADYEEAMRWAQKSMKSCDISNSSICKSGNYNLYGVIYIDMKDFKKAKEYTQKAFDFANENNQVAEKSRAASNLAIIFAEEGLFSESEKWFQKDLELVLQMGDTISAANNLSNLGMLQELQGKNSDALSYYTRALRLATDLNDIALQAVSHINVGQMYGRLQNYPKALQYLQIGLGLTKKLGDKNMLKGAYFNISKLYDLMNNHKKSLEYFTLFHNLNDSLVGENQLKAISELEVQYETQKKENELLKLSKEKQENELLIARQGRRVRQLSFGLGGLALLGVLGFFLFKQRLQNKKQQELLLAISETQTDERKRIAQDLHDSIGGSLALTKAKFETAKTKLGKGSNELESALETLDKTTKQVRQISHNLMPGELVRFGLVAAINTLLENVNEEEINAQFHTNQGEERLEPLKEIQLYRIVQEALQNILKHAQAKNLFIQLNKRKDQLSLMIEDDGKGMPESPREGMGLKNIKQRVQLLKGIFTVDSSPERGTVLNVQIPV